MAEEGLHTMHAFNEFKGIEVSGGVVLGLIQAFGQFKALASQLLLAEGIGEKGPDGLVIVDASTWYPADAQLRALAHAHQQMGDSVLHQIGVAVAKNVQWPSSIKDIRTMTEALDQGYHMNHRKHGRLMWEPERNTLLEGIGHYRCKPRSDGSMEIEATNPYPCAFDKGLLFGAMRRLHAVGSIRHDEAQACRKRGHPSCVYVVRD